MMEEADGDANRHEASTKIDEGTAEHLYHLKDYDECSQKLLQYTWYPFKSAYEFRMACYFILSKTSQGNIDSFFLHAPSSSSECSYSTGRDLIKRLEKMKYILGKASCHHLEVDIGGSGNLLLLAGSNGNCAISSKPMGLSGVIGIHVSGRA
jgi:hypothetical protein